MIFMKETLDEIKETQILSVKEVGFNQVEEGEEILGEVNEETKKIYSLLLKKKKSIAKRQSEHLMEHILHIENGTIDKCKKFHKEIEREEAKVELLRALFWGSVKEAFGVGIGGEYGIREGWSIVSLPERDIQAHINFIL